MKTTTPKNETLKAQAKFLRAVLSLIPGVFKSHTDLGYLAGLLLEKNVILRNHVNSNVEVQPELIKDYTKTFRLLKDYVRGKKYNKRTFALNPNTLYSGVNIETLLS